MPTVILMAGTGSDDDYLRRSFGPAVAEAGADLQALAPSARLIDDYLDTLDAAADAAAAAGTTIVVGGVSIGAVVALRWVLDRGGAHCSGVLAALPPWSGPVGDSLAALSARVTADAVERDGLEPTIAAMAATSPPWLAAELSRSWRALADRDLVGQLRTAAAYRAPTLAEIAELPVPLAIAGALDDPLHPIEVARDWARAAPHAALTEIALSEWGPQPHLLGAACVNAWRDF
ncbi:alpha/beta hydrolase [Gordonia alkaliphila]|uniref:alpha/beta hydrolase n=1 Tax=Gordonia alkaliphila TaxID=1053547 RepID=UPI001FF68015|nr:alpha/beta hydrolase [Gordonia alkaliphila]MCK0440490.1 alpha/beta hydrolase [Gordonia alkaliphila]